MYYSTAAVGAAIFAYQRLQPRLNLKESEPFIPYKALLIVLSSVSHTAAMSCTAALGLHYALNCTIFDATVAPAFILGSTHSCYGSSLAYAGLHHTNEHLCDHVFITILLTSTLLSPRPG